jgi:hypothetical protein
MGQSVLQKRDLESQLLDRPDIAVPGDGHTPLVRLNSCWQGLGDFR